jgi:hypothetical protein
VPSSCTALNNVIMAGDFERAGAGAYWTTMPSGVLMVEGSTVHSGMFAAQVSAPFVAPVSLRSQPTYITTMDVDYCAEAWVKAAPSTGPITLQLSRRFMVDELSPVGADSMVSPDGGWQRLTTRFAYPMTYFILSAIIGGSFSTPGEFFVDDVCVQVCP